MKGWSEIKDFFAVSKKDRIGLSIMAVIILILAVLPDIPQAEKWWQQTEIDTSWIAEWNQFLDMMDDHATERKTGQALLSSPEKTVKGDLFLFDPNTISEADWKRLGLRPKTIQTILNYRIKGGVFRKPEDLGRVYGLFPDEYERLKPFIAITRSSPAPTRDSVSKRFTAPREIHFSNRAIDINVADSIAWEALPGIGPKLAQRIIRFRDALGGFYSVDQVAETFGLPDSTFIKIRPLLNHESTNLQRIQINEATEAELSAHPYIGKKLARLTIAFRTQHGPFADIHALEKIPGFDEEKIRKLRPYLLFPDQ